jgi:hypothetical protein
MSSSPVPEDSEVVVEQKDQKEKKVKNKKKIQVQQTEESTEEVLTTTIKRNKTAPKDNSTLQWSLSFDQPFAFKALIETVSNILKECHFEVKNTPQFKGLAIDSLDNSKSSMIIARVVAGKVETRTTDLSASKFCISLKTLNSFLQMATAKYAVEIQNFKSSADVQFNISEAENGGLVRSFHVPTLAKDPQLLDVKEIKSDYTVEMDFTRLQQICKLAKTMGAQDLCFTISEPKESKETNNLRFIHFTISAEGAGLDGKYIERFSTVTEWNSNEIRDQTGQITSSIVKFTNELGTDNPNVNESMQEKSAEFSGKLVQRLKQSFAVEYLHLFLKKMTTTTVVMRFSKEHALVLYCPLPGDDGNTSYVMLLLAPKQIEEANDA